MKVAILSDTLDKKPMRSVFGRRLVENLLKKPEVELYLVHFNKAENDPLYQRAHEIVIPRISLPWGSHFVSFIWFCLTTKYRFDIFHWLTARPYPFFWLMPAKRLVLTAHGGGDITAPGILTASKVVFNFTLKHFNGYLDAIFGTSKFGCQEIIDAYHTNPDKTFVSYVGLDPIYRPVSKEAIDKILKDHNLNIEKYFIYVGGLVIHKNVPRIIYAYDLLRKNMPQVKEKFIIIGGASSGMKEINLAVSKTTFAKDIIFLNFIPMEEMPAFYSGATALVFPSLNEGFGQPIIEAMGCGTPVITSNLASMPEVSGGASILVNPYKIEEIMVAMKKIIEDKSLRDQLSVKGIERAKMFTWEKYTEANFEVYKKVLYGTN